jgi:aquaporin Z
MPWIKCRPSSRGWALQQLWLFWLAPLVGAALGSLVYRTMLEREIDPPVVDRPSSREGSR